jgi:hypothetical protein
MLNQKYGSNNLAIPLGDPAPFTLRVEVLDEFCNNLRNQRFEALVPPVFLRI